jgi:hypothetical protein
MVGPVSRTSSAALRNPCPRAVSPVLITGKLMVTAAWATATIRRISANRRMGLRVCVMEYQR